MAIIKCKMCGGDIEFEAGATYGTCEYCGCVSTIPQVDEEAKLNQFNRANHFRRQCDFDKALAAYEKILEQDDKDAEAHWGAVLSRYGIEYVEDPATGKRIPTCHRVQVASILSDDDFQAALENAPDAVSRKIYQKQAGEIAEIQKSILAISANEKPYDVFICYKETDEDGQRTKDSMLAQDIYYGLTEKGYKVFFSRITLEDKLGQQYEPYIFAALNSAKVMLVIGTKPEYVNAVWVKNEWKRYLHRMAGDRKLLLIPCYRDMDPYDLPDELSNLQSQDMSRIGFMQDLLRGVEKVLAAKTEKPEEKKTVVVEQTAAVSSALAQVKRGNIALEDEDWGKADTFFEQALDYEPECAEAYLGKWLAGLHANSLSNAFRMLERKYETAEPERLQAVQPDEEHIKEMGSAYAVPYYLSEEEIREKYRYDLGYDSYVSSRKQQKAKQQEELKNDKLLIRAKQYAQGETMRKIEEAIGLLTAKLDERMQKAEEQNKKCIEEIKTAYQQFLKETDRKSVQASDEAKRRREQEYQAAVQQMEAASKLVDFDNAERAWNLMHGYKDSEEQAAKCRKEKERILREKEEAEKERERKEKRKRLIAAAAVIAVVAIVLLVTKVIIPNQNYNAAVALKEAGQYEDAITAFEAMNGYKDSVSQIEDCKYYAAVALKDAGKYEEAITAFKAIDGYKDSNEQISACQTALKDIEYNAAVALKDAGKYEEAITAFEALNGYKDSTEHLEECKYNAAVALKDAGKYEEAITAFKALKGYKDSIVQIEACQTAINDIEYNAAVALKDAGKYEEAIAAFKAMNGYKDSAAKAEELDEQYKDEKLKEASVGTRVYFGSYEQDNNTANGKEDIEWLVLDRQDNKILLISEKALDCKPYNTERNDVTWETCSLRNWLNSKFLNTAFSEEEQKRILKTTVSADKNPEYDTNPGNATTDQVFLLSISEANRYFTTDQAIQCAPTAYAKAKGAYTYYDYITAGGEAACCWWLRSPGSPQTYAAYVRNVGSVDSYGNIVYYGTNCVRPALWINLEP